MVSIALSNRLDKVLAVVPYFGSALGSMSETGEKSQAEKDGSAQVSESAGAEQNSVAQSSATSSVANVEVTKAKPKREKVALKQGYSLVRWMRDSQNAAFTGVQQVGSMRVTYEELKRHNTREDCWMALRGRVYNVTSFFEFHPGGQEILMEAAGRDCTQLFDTYHAWVNADAMLKHCLVGNLVGSGGWFR